MIKLGKTLIYPIFDVESIGEVPRGPRAHLEAVLKNVTLSDVSSHSRLHHTTSIIWVKDNGADQKFRIDSNHCRLVPEHITMTILHIPYLRSKVLHK